MTQGLVNSLITYAMLDMCALKVRNEQKLEEIRTAWHESKSLPRKAKKAARKRLILQWQIFSYADQMLNNLGIP